MRPLAAARRWLFERELRALAADAVGLGAVCLGAALALAPTFRDLTLYGGHDWDEMTAHRLLTLRSLLGFGQLPLWMPYACGGYSEWGNVVGATNLVSPTLPLYLLFELRLALRLELVLSVVLAALGTWLWAGQFTRRPALRSFVCLVFVANGRFALQAATGHLWHLEYCYLPWAFWAFERLQAGARLSLRPLALGAIALSLMVYTGGIYPLPHAVLLLGVYAAARAALERRLRPLMALGALGVLSLGLAAPKLLPIAIEFAERPRPIASREAIDFGILWQALTARGQTPGSRPVAIPQWGWHEYGMYVGWLPSVLIGLGALWPSSRRVLALELSGLVALALGFGAFHRYAPWTLLHELGPFRSQHVPTRWLYPALLLLGIVAVAAFDRLLARFAVGRRGELLLLGLCVVLAIDIGREASVPLAQAFWMRAPPLEKASKFEQFERVPHHLQYRRRDYAPEAVPAILAGSGVLQCNLHASLSVYAPRAENGRPRGVGARGRGAPDYRGEVFTQSGVGTAEIVAFSPNQVVVELHGGKRGDRLIYNQSFDPGWRVDERPSEPYRDAVSTRVEAANARYVFRFWPRGLNAGLGLFVLSLLGLLLVAWRRGERPAWRRATDRATAR